MKNFTIIIPAIKNSKYLKNTLEQCLKLDGDVYIIIVTESNENQYYSENNRVKYIIVKKGMYMSAKRNLAVKEAKTKYIGFLDSDSFPANKYWALNAIEALEKDSSIYAVGGPHTSPPDETKEQKDIGILKKSFLISGFRNYHKNIVPDQFVPEVPGCNFFMEREKYLNLDGMDENLYTGEDYDFSNRIISKGYNLLYLSKFHAYHYDKFFMQYIFERWDRGRLTAYATKNFFKKIFFKAKKSPFSYYSTYTFRFEYLCSSTLAIYTLFLPYFIFYNKFINLYIAVYLIYLLILLFETIRLTKISQRSILIFFYFFICTNIQSFASLLTFFNISINLQKYYRNINDQ